MGRWKPKKKPAPIPAWAASAPKDRLQEIVVSFPQVFPPYCSVRQIVEADPGILALVVPHPHDDHRFAIAESQISEEDFYARISHAALLAGMDPAYIHAFQVSGAWITLEQITSFLRYGTVVEDWIHAVHAHRTEFPPDADGTRSVS